MGLKDKPQESAETRTICTSGRQVVLVIKSLIHQQRVMENYRHRGNRRPLARC